MDNLTIKLPCKVGDTVYMLAERKEKRKPPEKFIISGMIDHFTIGDAGVPMADILLADGVWCEACEPSEYYVTESEAKTALAKELEKEGDNH